MSVIEGILLEGQNADMAALRDHLAGLEDGTFPFDALNVGPLAAASMAPAQFSANDCGISLYSTGDTTAAPNTESYLVAFLKNDADAYFKAGVLAFTVADPSATDGYGCTNVHSGGFVAGVYTDFYGFAFWGNDNGWTFFPDDLLDTTAPGDRIVRINNGDLDINQAARDGNAITLRSSDVATGMTDFEVTTAYGAMRKAVAAQGGLLVRGLTESNGGPALSLSGFSGAAANTTKSTAAEGVIQIAAALKSGTGVAVHGTDANLMCIANLSLTRFIFDAEGSAHSDVEWTTFDTLNDVLVLEGLDLEMRRRSGVQQEFGAFVDEARDILQREGIVNFYDDGPRAMFNWTRMHMLEVGAIRQLAGRMAAIENRLAALPGA